MWKYDKNKQVKWLKVKVLGYEKINPGVDKNSIEDKEFRTLATYKD